MTSVSIPDPAAGARAPAASFAGLELDPELVHILAKLGYAEPTPIQQQAIPPALDCRDILGCARTGTGKTAAFALPILDELLRVEPDAGRRPIRALVLAPTRELAAQIGESFRSYTPGNRVRCLTVFGGVGKEPQAAALRRGVDVLVATPGRLLDLMQDRAADLSRVEFFVLDEADRMLDMGFIEDVRRIARALPDRRQTMLFSATLPREIRDLASRLLDDPIEIAVDPIATPPTPISHAVYHVDAPRKLDLLLALLAQQDVDRALVFTRTKHRANRVAHGLVRARIEAAAIHGNKSQAARTAALTGFKSGRIRVVVATDVAARGIDVKDLGTVINFDLPDEPETYVHRVGRTGRAGASGTAWSLCAADERDCLASIERLIGQQIPRAAAPDAPESGIEWSSPQDHRRGPRGGQRGRRPGSSSRPRNGSGGFRGRSRSGGGGGAGRSRRGSHPRAGGTGVKPQYPVPPLGPRCLAPDLDAALVTSCIDCRKLHVPRCPLASNPRCGGCVEQRHRGSTSRL